MRKTGFFPAARVKKLGMKVCEVLLCVVATWEPRGGGGGGERPGVCHRI